jgi:hypothetical protein
LEWIPGQHNQHAANMVPTSANMPTFVVAGSQRETFVVAGSQRAAMVFWQQMDYILARFQSRSGIRPGASYGHQFQSQSER